MSFEFERLSERGRWEPPNVGAFFADKGLCGVSANRGLLRFHDAGSGPIAQSFLDATFGPAGTFAFDWMARQFAVTMQPVGGSDSAGTPLVVVIDPSDMTVTPWVPVTEFEQALALPLAQEFLQEDLFTEWLRVNTLPRLGFDRCAGATVPAFYGGTTALSNLDHNDIDVYLAFVQQLWSRAQHQSAGTPAPHIPSNRGR